MNHEGAWIHNDYTAEFALLDLRFGKLGMLKDQMRVGTHRGREIRFQSRMMFALEDALRDSYTYPIKEIEFIAREYSLARGLAVFPYDTHPQWKMGL